MMKHIAQLIVALLVVFFAAATQAPAQEQAQEHAHRVLGLFDKQRENDLRQLVQDLPGVELVSVDHQQGAAVFRYDAEQLFPGRKTPEQVIQGLDQLLRSASRGTFQVTAATGAARDALQRVEINIVGLDCRGCSFAAYLAVSDIDGVENATASFKAGKLIAWIDPTKTKPSELEESLEKKGVKLAGPE